LKYKLTGGTDFNPNAMSIREDYIKIVKRIVVKVGSSTLTHPNGSLNLRRIENLVRQLSDIHNSGIEVILVTSGAIAAGIGKLGLKSRPKSMPMKQAAAAVGQVALMHMYDKLFAEYGKVSSQILITKEDMNCSTRLVNAKNTFSALLKLKVIPIVNENDAIATEEIKFGDNDTLSAEVSRLTSADLLILLSDIDGLYDSNPSTNPDAVLIKYVNDITEDVYSAADGAGSDVGTGGMITKLNAAKIVMDNGSAMVIVNGSISNIISEVLEGQEIGTFFKRA
jgi:glutamate 5-kinase